MVHFLYTTLVWSLIAFLQLTFGADDIIIKVGQTLVSKNKVFEVGFFSPGRSRNLYLGIWYKATPEVVVWVANRNHAITHSEGIVLAISQNGSLAICRGGGRAIWSASPSTAASRPLVRLLDTGNLVVADADEARERDGYLWQSFDYPADTWLPGMAMVEDEDTDSVRFLTSWRNPDDPSVGDFAYGIENEGLPQLVIYRGRLKIFRTRKWNGIYFNGVPPFPNAIFRPELVFRKERLMSVLVRPHENSAMTRTKLEVSGSIQRYTLNARRNKWSGVSIFPRDQCDEYGHCGKNGVCTIEKAQRCECFSGFSPEFPDDWGLQDWNGGCGRVAPLDCGGGDGFVEVRGVKYPDMLSFRLNTSMSLVECREECLRNCTCTAYANTFITNGGSGCLMWFGDLVDARELSASEGMQNMYIRVPLSELGFGTNSEEEEEDDKRPIKIILISTVFGALVSSFINGGILVLKRRKKQAAKRKVEDIELPLMEMKTILEATNSLSRENIIGEGGFGFVYMGTLSAGEQIAVKRLSKTSGQGLEEFKNEVILIAKLQHRNLVRLLGCCIEGEERMLIYEYLQNKSLDYFVFDPDQRKLLSWPIRFDIIMGIARGLLYLHHDSRLKIIHRDLKTSNVLLDANFNPKISDFGLARSFEEKQSMSRTKRVIGTYGYMAPEYAFHGIFSVKSDVYSLGVVLLEIISGEKNRGFGHDDHHHSLLGHAWLLWKEKRVLELMDESLNGTSVESKVKRCIHVGLLCVQRLAEDRPIMASVVLMLATDGAILPEPNEPGFFVEGKFSSLHIINPTRIHLPLLTWRLDDEMASYY